MYSNVFALVRNVLIESWDPIGLGGAQIDEYDRYARDIVDLIENGRRVEDIESYLRWAENYIGVDVSVARTNEVALKLSSLEK